MTIKHAFDLKFVQNVKNGRALTRCFSELVDANLNVKRGDCFEEIFRFGH
jgi:hypothetical protein